MMKHRTHLHPTKRITSALIVCGLLIGAGAIALLTSHAASPFLSMQQESGTITAPAIIVTDTAASNGKAVQYNAGNPTPPPGPILPSGQAIPLGDLPGWKQTMAEDFKTDTSTTSFDGTYANSWCGYNDGTGGIYFKVISAAGGLMRINLDGTRGAAGSFGPPATCWGGLYGKYTMRFKVTGAAGYGAANMVWPSGNIWGNGEVDYPEGGFGGNMNLFQHGISCTDCSANIASLNTGKTWTDWHTVSTEWTSTGVKYYLDDVLIKTVTTNIPIHEHRWTLQMAKTGTSSASGTFDIDWVTSYSKL